MNLKNESYRCTVHEKYLMCSAIDYMIHNLDHSTEILLGFTNEPKNLKTKDEQPSIIERILKRVYRIFAHSMSFHESLFMEFEKEMYLYKRFFFFLKHFNINQKDQMFEPSI